jgi:MINDY deubiquitinase
MTGISDMATFDLKWIAPEDGKPKYSIVLQSSAGPCPLLALANVLSLRRDIRLPCNATGILPARLLSCIASLPSSSDANTLDTLPLLASSVAVDPKFCGTTDFAPSDELKVFESFGIRVVHGALPDPQDERVYDAISPCSFNQVCDFLVAAAVANAEEPAERSRPSNSGSIDADVIADLRRRNTPSTSDSQLISASEPGPSALPVDDDDDDFDDDMLRSIKTSAFVLAPHLHSSTAVDVTAASAPEQPAADTRGPPTRSAPLEGSQVFENAFFVQEFLSSFPGMMSYYGLTQLYETVQSGELCVFFFNNHFSVLTKHEDFLYTLVTDAGYKNEPNVVWEQLTDLDGDSSFYDSRFERAVIVNNSTSTSAATVSGKGSGMRARPEAGKLSGTPAVMGREIDGNEAKVVRTRKPSSAGTVTKTAKAKAKAKSKSKSGCIIQ